MVNDEIVPLGMRIATEKSQKIVLKQIVSSRFARVLIFLFHPLENENPQNQIFPRRTPREGPAPRPVLRRSGRGESKHCVCPGGKHEVQTVA
jgi:hypothetical protein